MTDPIYAQRYKLRKRLPDDGAVARYSAHDDAGRPLLVTVLRPFDADALLRTIGEVSAVRHLDLAAVVDAGREGADCFVVEADPGGTPASALVQRGPLPVATAALFGAEAAAGLAALHERGLVHGGVGPHSVWQAGDGSVKLTGAGQDQGLRPPDLAPGAPPEAARYLSPEEAAGHAPTAASDVYRAGLVLYLLLTGRHAFDGVDARTVAQEQLDGVVQPPQLLNPEVPPALAQVVLRTLDKDPRRRGTAAQMLEDVKRVLGAAEVREVPQKPRSRAWVWVLAFVAVAAVAVVAAWALGAFDTNTTPSAEKVKVPDVTGMTASKAASVLQEAGLKVGKTTQVDLAGAVAGTVVKQSPASGTEVKKGAEVDIEVAAEASPTAPASVAVPGVIGQSQADAEATLAAAGFVVVATQAQDATVPAGEVFDQSPQAGVMAATGSTVNITVSSGAPTASPAASASP